MEAINSGEAESYRVTMRGQDEIDGTFGFPYLGSKVQLASPIGHGARSTETPNGTSTGH
jgi:hypothetical protein